uniref:Immunoglobulin domain-containing protein n=1 Tax=Sinocyclocheilus rhinocerous TaxID=307959 RepID=A0A673LD17_9TELE
INYIFVFPGVFGDDVVTVMEGDTVTLHTDITKKEHDKMLWYFEDTRIALINGHPNTSCLYDGEDGRFRDRLEVDYKTGSLIITDITTEHAGRYEAEIIRSESSGKRQSLNRNRKCDSTKITKKISISHDDTIKTFSMIVIVVFADTDELKSVKEGDSVTLHIDVNKQLNDLILWFFNNTRIALNNGERDKSCVYDGADGMFRGRLELDYETGSLTITNITTEHTGRYEANIIRGNSTGTSKPLNRTRKCDSTKINSKSSNSGDTIKTFNVNVNAVPGSGLSSAAVAGIVVGVLLVAAAAVGVIYYRDRKSRNGKYYIQIQ